MAFFIHSFLQVLDEDDIFIHSFRPQGFRMGVQADQPQWDLEVALEGCEGISISKCETDHGRKGCEGTYIRVNLIMVVLWYGCEGISISVNLIKVLYDRTR